MVSCALCLEDNVDIAFSCLTKKCRYEICAPCVKLALEDASGENCRLCPICKTPTARRMVESICGKGAVREVERALRSRVEQEVQQENLKKDRGRELMCSYEDRARKLFLELSDLLNTKCPRCGVVFDDYEGCNALYCRNSGCGAKFCAVCLLDCDGDAHTHARTHGNLFDKSLFQDAKAERERATISLFLREHGHEPFEVKELLRIKAEKVTEGPLSLQGGVSVSGFLGKAKASLRVAVRQDRLSVLCESGTPPRALTSEDISPRNRIPEDYALRLVAQSGFKCQVTLGHLVDGRWKVIPLPNDDDDDQNKKDGGNRPTVDALINVRRSLQSCSIAFERSGHLYQTVLASLSKEERLSDTEISVKFLSVRATGDVLGEGLSLAEIGCSRTKILGFNQNRRMLLLEQHVDQSSPETLLFEPLLHFIGAKPPVRLLQGESTLPAPDTFKELNTQQQLVAHPLSIRTAMECAGPPGTGKTKTITELVRSVLFCTGYNVIVLSERNGAIDAIAEKMARDCIIGHPKSKRRTVKDFVLWKRLLAFGSAGMGPYARLFTLEAKLKIHPEMEEHRRLIDEKRQVVSKLTGTMLHALAGGIEDLSPSLPEGSDAATRSDLIASGREADLTRPSEIVQTVADALAAVRSLLSMSDLTEERLGDEVVQNSSVLGHLLPVVDKRKTTPSLPWHQRKRNAVSALKCIAECFQKLLRTDAFSADTADECQFAVKEAEENHSKAALRIKTELLEDARVMLATIGSSHKMPVPGDKESAADIEDALDRLGARRESKKETIVVFDEAGCIPAYELLGLSRLKRSIKAMICVGDKHQLPPYAPNSMGSGGRCEEVESLLDVSRLSDDNGGGKIRLTTQYRVPRDIADILNVRIYKGHYRTAINNRSIPKKGFQFVDVNRNFQDKKYENENEVTMCLQLVERVIAETGTKSIMILTPYKKQQRKLQFAFKKRGYGDAFPILSIDQCQGQEADYVLLSLVQKPTRFLNKNRFTVALSRVRKKLFLLTNEKEFQEAAKNSKWECCLIAKDLLKLAAAAGDQDGGLESDDSDDFYDAYYR